MEMVLCAALGALLAQAFFDRDFGRPAVIAGAVTGVSPFALRAFGDFIEATFDPVRRFLLPNPVWVELWLSLRDSLPSALTAVTLGPLAGVFVCYLLAAARNMFPRPLPWPEIGTGLRLGLAVWLAVSGFLMFLPAGLRALAPLGPHIFFIPALDPEPYSLALIGGSIPLLIAAFKWPSVRRFLARSALISLIIYLLAAWALKGVPEAGPCEFPGCIEIRPGIEV